MFIRLSDTPNRAVLYDLYPYIWDVKEVVLLLDSFINWLGKSTLFAIVRRGCSRGLGIATLTMHHGTVLGDGCFVCVQL